MYFYQHQNNIHIFPYLYPSTNFKKMQNSQKCNIKHPCPKKESKGNIPKFPSKTKFKLGKSLTIQITKYYILLLCCPTNYFVPLTLLYVLHSTTCVFCYLFFSFTKHKKNTTMVTMNMTITIVNTMNFLSVVKHEPSFVLPLQSLFFSLCPTFSPFFSKYKMKVTMVMTNMNTNIALVATTIVTMIAMMPVANTNLTMVVIMRFFLRNKT